MIRNFFAGLLCLFSTITFGACGDAKPVNDVGFCSSFKSVATCYCTTAGLPKPLCTDMKMLYTRIVSIYGSLEKGCANQRNTTPQNCIANWNCYRLGKAQQTTSDGKTVECLTACEKF